MIHHDIRPDCTSEATRMSVATELTSAGYVPGGRSSAGTLPGGGGPP